MSSGMQNAQNFAAIISSMVLEPSFFGNFSKFPQFSRFFMFSHFSMSHFSMFSDVFHFLGLRDGMFSQNMGLEGVFPYLGMGVGGYFPPFWGWGGGGGVWGVGGVFPP